MGEEKAEVPVSPFLTGAEASAIARTTLVWLRRHFAPAGEIEICRQGRRVFVVRESLMQFLDARTIRKASPCT